MDRITHILWDNDGILVNTEDLYFEATRETLAEYGVELTLQIYIDTFLRQSIGVAYFKDEFSLTEPDLARIRSVRDERYTKYLHTQAPLMPGVHETLQTLGKRFTMAVVTSTLREHLRILHEKHDLCDYFDLNVTNEDFTHSKPHPEPYLTAMEKLEVSPEQCIAIEDSERGFRAAREAGIACIAIPTPLTQHGDFTDAHAILGNLAELQSLLLD
jgi:HAD superfamily hydrolase (TIGR01509 family)